jgi:hypothetical protein
MWMRLCAACKKLMIKPTGATRYVASADGNVAAPCIDADGGRSNEPIRHQIALHPRKAKVHQISLSLQGRR